MLNVWKKVNFKNLNKIKNLILLKYILKKF